MRSASALACALLLLAGPARADVDKAEAARQMTFGVKMAQAGSWNEAAFRFTKAVHANPGNAFAQNDLGVALESIGQYDQALASYTKALELEPGNAKIKENKDRLQAYLATRNAPKPKEKPAPPAPGGAGG